MRLVVEVEILNHCSIAIAHIFNINFSAERLASNVTFHKSYVCVPNF